MWAKPCWLAGEKSADTSMRSMVRWLGDFGPQDCDGTLTSGKSRPSTAVESSDPVSRSLSFDSGGNFVVQGEDSASVTAEVRLAAEMNAKAKTAFASARM